MKRRRNRGEEAIAKAAAAIEAAGWIIVQTGTSSRFVAMKLIAEREDDSTTKLYESDYTVEGLKVLVERREREENRKS